MSNVTAVPSKRHTKISLAELRGNFKHLAILLYSYKNLLIQLAVWLQFLWLLETTIKTSKIWECYSKKEKNVKGIYECFLSLQVLLLCWNAMVPKKNSCYTICHTTNLHISRGTIWKCFTDYYSPHKAADTLLLTFLTKLTSAYGISMRLWVYNCQ